MALPPSCITGHEPLSRHTTIGLGGPALWFARCTTADDVLASLTFAKEEGLPVQVFAGGSNIIFADQGFAGLVLQVALPGFRAEQSAHGVRIVAGAGEAWDSVVSRAVGMGCVGIECLSGIPGSTGGTPVQNVGAYGQEVSGTFESLSAIDRRTLKEKEFSRPECGFAYRESRFKTSDAGRYIITEVRFHLSTNAAPEIRYPELARELQAQGAGGKPGTITPHRVREAVIALRRKKSMVIDAADGNSMSVGSFFTNPVVTSEFFQARFAGQSVPTYPAPGGVKLSAAWLVEGAGFHKGFRRGGAGISDNHALAIVNRGGTTADVIALAEEIETRVHAKFGLRLQREPVIVPFT